MNRDGSEESRFIPSENEFCAHLKLMEVGSPLCVLELDDDFDGAINDIV